MIFYIGFSGKMGTGKTTTANLLFSKFEHDHVLRTSFSSMLKKEVGEIYGLSDWQMNTSEGKETPIRMEDLVHKGWTQKPLSPDWKPKVTPREILQWYGTDHTRAKEPDYWVSALQVKMNGLQAKNPKKDMIVLVDDVRFQNEAEFIEKNGMLFRINPYSEWKEGEHSGHISETALDDWHWKDVQVFTPQYGCLDLVAKIIYKFCDTEEKRHSIMERIAR